MRLARWLATGLGLLIYGLLGWYVRIMLNFGATVYLPGGANSAPHPPAVAERAVDVGSGQPGGAELAWGWRIHYSLIALAAATLLWSLHFWNLLAF